MKSIENPRIYIAIPSQDTWEAEFGQCLQSMMVHTHNWLRENTDGGALSMQQDFGTLLAGMRNSLTTDALEMGASHIMWLDNDMVFPDDLIVRMLSRGKPAVVGNYPMRRRPCKPTVKRSDGTWLYTWPVSSGLEEAAAAGLGCALIETSIYTAMSAPWHMALPDDDDGPGVGEDYYFWNKLKVEFSDIEVWCDHDVSKQLGHIGRKIFDWTDAMNDRVIVKRIEQGKMQEPIATPRPHELYAEFVDIEQRVPSPEVYGAMVEKFEAELLEKEAALDASMDERAAQIVREAIPDSDGQLNG